MLHELIQQLRALVQVAAEADRPLTQREGLLNRAVDGVVLDLKG